MVCCGNVNHTHSYGEFATKINKDLQTHECVWKWGIPPIISNYSHSIGKMMMMNHWGTTGVLYTIFNPNPDGAIMQPSGFIQHLKGQRTQSIDQSSGGDGGHLSVWCPSFLLDGGMIESLFMPTPPLLGTSKAQYGFVVPSCSLLHMNILALSEFLVGHVIFGFLVRLKASLGKNCLVGFVDLSWEIVHVMGYWETILEHMTG